MPHPTLRTTLKAGIAASFGTADISVDDVVIISIGFAGLAAPARRQLVALAPSVARHVRPEQRALAGATAREVDIDFYVKTANRAGV